MPLWWITPHDPTAAAVWKASVQDVQALVRAQTYQEALALSIDVFKAHLVSPSILDTSVAHEEILAWQSVVGAGYTVQGASALLEVTGADSALEA
jgi:hypothetical protein